MHSMKQRELKKNKKTKRYIYSRPEEERRQKDEVKISSCETRMEMSS